MARSSDRSIEDNRLHVAIKLGDFEAIQRLLALGRGFFSQKQRVDVNAKDAQGNTPLHLAIAAQRTDIIDLLLGQPNINVNCQDKKGDTPLHLLIRADMTRDNHDLGMAIFEKLLMAPNIDVNLKNKDGQTPLHVICSNNIRYATAVSTMYLEQYNASRVNESAKAQRVHTHALIEALLKKGALRDIKDTRSNTPRGLFDSLHKERAGFVYGHPDSVVEVAETMDKKFESAVAQSNTSQSLSSHVDSAQLSTLPRSASAPVLTSPFHVEPVARSQRPSLQISNAKGGLLPRSASAPALTQATPTVPPENAQAQQPVATSQLVTRLNRYIQALEAKVERQEKTLLGRAHLWLAKLNPANKEEKIKVATALRDAHNAKNKASISKIYSNSKNCFLLSEGNLGKIVLSGNAPVIQQHVRKRSNSI